MYANITTQLSVLKNADIKVKTKFLSDILLNKMDRLIEKSSFIENIKIPMESINDDSNFNSLLNGIFGYYVYLYDNKILNADNLFLTNSLHDLRTFLKESNDRLITKRYFIYLK